MMLSTQIRKIRHPLTSFLRSLPNEQEKDSEKSLMSLVFLIEEIEQTRERIAEEQVQNERNRKPFQWNGNVYHCACRGLFEELGLIENSDFSVSDILLLGFGLDTEYYMCGLRGLMKVPKTAHDIMKNWQAGVKDKMENKKLFAIPFTLEDVCEFVLSHGPWGVVH